MENPRLFDAFPHCTWTFHSSKQDPCRAVSANPTLCASLRHERHLHTGGNANSCTVLECKRGI